MPGKQGGGLVINLQLSLIVRRILFRPFERHECCYRKWEGWFR